jgi:CBS domain containing-hemolysin-like protein
VVQLGEEKKSAQIAVWIALFSSLLGAFAKLLEAIADLIRSLR